MLGWSWNVCKTEIKGQKVEIRNSHNDNYIGTTIEHTDANKLNNMLGGLMLFIYPAPQMQLINLYK